MGFECENKFFSVMNLLKFDDFVVFQHFYITPLWIKQSQPVVCTGGAGAVALLLGISGGGAAPPLLHILYYIRIFTMCWGAWGCRCRRSSAPPTQVLQFLRPEIWNLHGKMCSWMKFQFSRSIGRDSRLEFRHRKILNLKIYFEQYFC